MEPNITDTNFLKPGSTLAKGRYKIEKHLASGGFGNTYVAYDNTSNTQCCIKEFFIKGDTHRENNTGNISVSNPEKKALFASMRSKFQKEANRLMSLNSPNIVKVNDSFDENCTSYYVMELIKGVPLDKWMKERNRPFSEEEAFTVLEQMLDALEEIHSKGLLHMDIKPANILITENGVCKLIDFGASKQADPTSGNTTSGICYTMGYAPPEQISGNSSKWGACTDFYALGATFYYLLTGKKPPTQDDLLTDGEAVMKFPANVSDKTQELVKWFMKLSPNERPHSIGGVRKFIKWQRQQQNIKASVALDYSASEGDYAYLDDDEPIEVIDAAEPDNSVKKSNKAGERTATPKKNDSNQKKAEQEENHEHDTEYSSSKSSGHQQYGQQNPYAPGYPPYGTNQYGPQGYPTYGKDGQYPYGPQGYQPYGEGVQYGYPYGMQGQFPQQQTTKKANPLIVALLIIATFLLLIIIILLATG